MVHLLPFWRPLALPLEAEQVLVLAAGFLLYLYWVKVPFQALRQFQVSVLYQALQEYQGYFLL